MNIKNEETRQDNRPSRAKPPLIGTEVTDEDRKAPTFLKGEAKKFFLNTFDLLRESGAIKKSDLQALALVASTWGDLVFWSKAVNDAQRQKDYELASKLTSKKDNATRLFLSGSAKLGLNSLDRGRIRTEKPKKENALEKLFLDDDGGGDE